MSQALTNWNTDNLATGILAINPDLYEVCLGQDFTLTLDDATLLIVERILNPINLILVLALFSLFMELWQGVKYQTYM